MPVQECSSPWKYPGLRRDVCLARMCCAVLNPGASFPTALPIRPQSRRRRWHRSPQARNSRPRRDRKAARRVVGERRYPRSGSRTTASGRIAEGLRIRARFAGEESPHEIGNQLVLRPIATTYSVPEARRFIAAPSVALERRRRKTIRDRRWSLARRSLGIRVGIAAAAWLRFAVSPDPLADRRSALSLVTFTTTTDHPDV